MDILPAAPAKIDSGADHPAPIERAAMASPEGAPNAAEEITAVAGPTGAFESPTDKTATPTREEAPEQAGSAVSPKPTDTPAAQASQTEPPCPAVPFEVQQRVYQVLAGQFPFEQPFPMATIAAAINAAGIDRTAFGFRKMKAFLAEMDDFLTLTGIIAGGVPQSLVTLHERPGWGHPEPMSDASDTGSTGIAGDQEPAVAVLAEVVGATRRPASDAPESGAGVQASGHPGFATRPTQPGIPTTRLHSGRPTTHSPSRELERFAWLGPWNDFLSQLAAMALPESWDFEAADERPAGQRPFTILKSFICTTFYRLKLEDKVLVNEAGTFAAFNTGLFDRRYDDIYACFEPSNQGSSDSRAPWRFVGLCTRGVRTLGKRLVSTFNPCPEPASYFASKDDLLYDLDRELVVDYDHIIIDNIARLPIACLREELGENAEMAALLDEAEAPGTTPEHRQGLLGQVGRALQDNPRLFRRLRRQLTDAVDIAQRRIRWNYKTAIPSYYPRANTMSLLLPLCLVEDDVADVALVVQLMPSGVYQGQTILTMRQAYMNARLICRPDSDWLTTVGRSDTDEESEEEE